MRRVSSHLTTSSTSAHRDPAWPTIDLDPGIGVWEPGLTSIDLTKFKGLNADAQRKVIVRVLCGLVALEEGAVGTAARRAARPERPDPLPFIDNDSGEIDLRELPPPPPTGAPPASRRLPFFGLRRPF